jgi:hypothetical protein
MRRRTTTSSKTKQSVTSTALPHSDVARTEKRRRKDSRCVGIHCKAAGARTRGVAELPKAQDVLGALVAEHRPTERKQPSGYGSYLSCEACDEVAGRPVVWPCRVFHLASQRTVELAAIGV